MVNSSILFGLILAVTMCQVSCIPYQDPPYGKKQAGYFTYNRGNGKGACGTTANYETDMIVAVNCSYWKTFPSGNPNEDPICDNTCLKVTKGSKTIQVKVVDQCCGCGTDHIDLSVAAYKALEPDMNIGEVKGVTWEFIHCDGSASSSPGSGSGSNENNHGSDSSKGENSGENGSNKNSGSGENNRKKRNDDNGNNGILGGLFDAFGSMKNFVGGIFNDMFGRISNLLSG